jgi:hypothetical protein
MTGLASTDPAKDIPDPANAASSAPISRAVRRRACSLTGLRVCVCVCVGQKDCVNMCMFRSVYVSMCKHMYTRVSSVCLKVRELTYKHISLCADRQTD